MLCNNIIAGIAWYVYGMSGSPEVMEAEESFTGAGGKSGSKMLKVCSGTKLNSYSKKS